MSFTLSGWVSPICILANQSFGLDEAIRRLQAFQPFQPYLLRSRSRRQTSRATLTFAALPDCRRLELTYDNLGLWGRPNIAVTWGNLPSAEQLIWFIKEGNISTSRASAVLDRSDHHRTGGFLCDQSCRRAKYGSIEPKIKEDSDMRFGTH
jgi:hypothetical protein